jgi:uncharacterized protein (TIGR00251 family)
MRLKLRVKPGAPRTCVVGPYGDRLKIDVAAPPEDGKANAALVAFLAERLGIPRERVSVVRGSASRDKEVAVTGLDLGEAMGKLAP